MRHVRVWGLIGFVLITLMLLLVATPAYPTAAYAARSATPTAALDPAALDMSKATRFRSKDGTLEILVPRGWLTNETSTSGLHLYSFGYLPPGKKLGIAMVIILGSTRDVYSGLFQSSSITSPGEALDIYKQTAPSNVQMGEIESASLGDYSGSKIGIISSATQSTPAFQGEIWVLEVPPDQVMMLILGVENPFWKNGGQDILYKMLDTLKLNQEGNPSSEDATPTNEPTSGAPVPTRTKPPSSGRPISPIPLLPNQ